MIDPMLRRLNELCPTLALADDLVCIAKGNDKLDKLLRLLGDCCEERSFTINKKKSAIMEIRIDGRQSERKGSRLGFPFTSSYKYLGIQIDDCLKLDVDKKSREKKANQLKKQLWMIK